MANTNLTHQKVARMAAEILTEEAPFLANINRGRQDEFGKDIDGYKIGSQVTIKVPAVGSVYDGAVYAAGGAGEDNVEQSVVLSLNKQKHNTIQFGAKEKLLEATDFRERYLRPKMQTLASVIEADLLSMAYAATPNVVGTAGTTPTAMITYAGARARLQNFLAPPSDRSVVFSSDANTALVDTSRVLFNPSKNIEKQYITGAQGEAQGAMFYEHQSVPLHTNGTQASWTVNGANQTGSTLAIGGLTSGNTIKKGTSFTIAGVYAVHPQTGVPYATLQQFVVTADFTASATTGSISIYPAIAATNPNKTVSALAANGAACTLFGSANTSYRQNLMFQKDAFTAAFAPLPVLASCEGYTARLPNGISVRVMTFGDGINDLERTRIDVLYGFAAVRPLHSVRITE